MQRLHDKVNGNWQKFTAIVYEINKSRDIKKRIGNHIWKKVFESMIMTEKRIPPDICTSYFLQIFRQFCPLFEPDFYTKLDEKLS